MTFFEKIHVPFREVNPIKMLNNYWFSAGLFTFFWIAFGFNVAFAILVVYLLIIYWNYDPKKTKKM